MPKPKIFVTRSIPKPGLDRLEEVFEVHIHASDKAIERNALLEAVQNVDALLCLLTDSIDKELIDAAGRLKCVSNFAVGYNNVDVAYASAKNIVVCNTPGVLTESTADLAWALLMACARRVVEADRYLRDGLFTGWEPLLFLGNDVFGKTLGIIGMGRIGQAVARRAEGFGMKILWHGPRPEREDLPAAYQWTDLQTLCQKSDYISIHAPLTSENHHLLGEKELAWMKASAILINTARGPIVDELALIKALQNREIAAAGLDVFEQEPAVPQALMDLPNVVLLPHIGSASIETRNKMALMAAENASAVIQGKEPPARLN